MHSTEINRLCVNKDSGVWSFISLLVISKYHTIFFQEFLYYTSEFTNTEEVNPRQGY